MSPELHHTDQDWGPRWAPVYGHWPNHLGKVVSKQGGSPTPWQGQITWARWFPTRGRGRESPTPWQGRITPAHLSQSIRVSSASNSISSSPKWWPLTFHNRENRGEPSDPSFSPSLWTNALHLPAYYSWEPSPTPFSPAPPCMGTRSS